MLMTVTIHWFQGWISKVLRNTAWMTLQLFFSWASSALHEITSARDDLIIFQNGTVYPPSKSMILTEPLLKWNWNESWVAVLKVSVVTCLLRSTCFIPAQKKVGLTTSLSTTQKSSCIARGYRVEIVWLGESRGAVVAVIHTEVSPLLIQTIVTELFPFLFSIHIT